MRYVISASATPPTANAYGKISEITKVPTPTLFLFLIVVYKFEQRVPECFGHFYTKTRLRPPKNLFDYRIFAQTRPKYGFKRKFAAGEKPIP
jgi:hypothetical protein